MIGVGFWKVAENSFSCLNIKISKIGCNHFGLGLEEGFGLIGAGKCLNESWKKIAEIFLTLCSVSFDKVVQFVIVQVWIW